MRKITFITILFAFFTFINSASASVAILQPSNTSVGIREQFYVDVLLDPQDVSINGIEGIINFRDDLLTYVRAEDGKSVINLWIQKPVIDRGSVSFAGIIPNGFSGIIDPFNSSTKKSGLIIRLVFEAKKSGAAVISTSAFTVTENNGEGTTINTQSVNTTINVGSVENPYTYKNTDDTTPTLIASVIRDPDLFSNKYTLVFDASDKSSGIESVTVKEGNRNFKRIESPYLLEDQTRHSTIIVRATNFSGNNFTITIDPLPYNLFSPSGLILLVALIIAALYFIRRKYVKKK